MNYREHANEVTRINRKFEIRFVPIIKRSLKTKVNMLTSIIKERGLSEGFAYLSTDLTNPQLVKAVTQLYKTVGLYHARLNEKRLRLQTRQKSFNDIETKEFSFVSDWLSTILDYLKRFMLEKLTFKVNQTQRKVLLSVLTQAQNEGWGIDKTVSELDSLPFTQYQAARIVRTEITRATGAGTRAQAKTFEYQTQKKWIAVRDNRTRGVNPKDHASHIAMNGQTVDEDEFFIDPKNGNVLRFPGDPDAPAVDTVNCRCVAATIAKRDEKGNFIPKSKKPSRISIILPGERILRQIITI